MVVIKVYRDFNFYCAHLADKLVFTARDVSTIFNSEVVKFYDDKNMLFASSKNKIILMFNLGHKITFTESGKIGVVKGVWNASILKVDNDLYKITRHGIDQKDELKKNNVVAGTIERVSSESSRYENIISCLNYDDAKMFAILSVLTYTFNVS